MAQEQEQEQDEEMDIKLEFMQWQEQVTTMEQEQ